MVTKYDAKMPIGPKDLKYPSTIIQLTFIYDLKEKDDQNTWTQRLSYLGGTVYLRWSSPTETPKTHPAIVKGLTDPGHHLHSLCSTATF